MRAKRRSAPSEHQEQAAVVQWWAHYCRTKGLDERLLFASYNGAWLAGDARVRAIQMAKAKRMGLRRGVPDLILAYPKYDTASKSDHFGKVLFCGLFVEMKAIGGRSTVEQIEYADILRRAGFNAIIAEGADEAIRAIRAYIEV